MSIHLDTDLRNADWLRGYTWDLFIDDRIVQTLEELIEAVSISLEDFLKLPVAAALPKDLREQIEQPAAKHLSGRHDQSTHARGGSAAEIVPAEYVSFRQQQQPARDHIKQGDDVGAVTARNAAKSYIVQKVSDRILAAATPEQKEKLAVLSMGEKHWNRLSVENQQKYLELSAELGAKIQVDYMLRTWAASSNGRNPDSVALQMAAAKEFGGSLKKMLETDKGDLVGKATVESARKIDKEHGDLNRLALRAMYEHTQEQLAAEGLKEVVLYRGIAAPKRGLPTWVKEGSEGEIGLRPLSSFSAENRIARDFAALRASDPEGTVGIVATARVPASRILSTARTGLGCLPEYEYTVLGHGKTKVHGKVTFMPRDLE